MSKNTHNISKWHPVSASVGFCRNCGSWVDLRNECERECPSHKKESQAMKQKETNAGEVAPSTIRYRITETHDHATLKSGDRVVMVEDDRHYNVLFRFSDCTLHQLEDGNGQYVHLLPLPVFEPHEH